MSPIMVYAPGTKVELKLSGAKGFILSAKIESHEHILYEVSFLIQSELRTLYFEEFELIFAEPRQTFIGFREDK